MAKKEILVFVIWIIGANIAADLKIYCREVNISIWFLSVVLLGGVLSMGWILGRHFRKERIE